MRASSLLWAASLGVLTALLLAAPTPAADDPGPAKYEVKVDPNIVISHDRNGKQGTFVTAHFQVTRTSDKMVEAGLTRDDLVVLEDGEEVAEAEIILPESALTTVLAIHIRDSPASNEKIAEAQKAAHTFLDQLDPKADSGLIVAGQPPEPPGRDPAQYSAHRKLLNQKVDKAQAGGTAYLDDTAQDLRMLQGVAGRKAVVLMTDGVDLNSVQTQQQVIDLARASGIPIYTVGIGTPANDVTTVLVLDHSGSMAAKAEEGDQKPKIQALREAASRFVDLMGPTARTTLLPFSSDIDTPQPFSSDKVRLKQQIEALQPATGTLLYDATWTGVETLAASRLPGKKAVVVLTDGVDESPGSRRTDHDVIEAANAAGVQLYMLGLGPADEINEPVMKEMADATHGAYFHATNQQKLFDIFNKLSIDLHDAGIDEDALKALAHKTGGEYYPSRNVSDLRQVCQKVSQDLSAGYTVIYPSRYPDDGTARKIKVVVRQNGRDLSEGGESAYATHGVVPPQMDHLVYLVLLVGLAALLAAPAGLRRLQKRTGG